MIVDIIMEADGGDEIRATDGDTEVKVGEEDVNVGKKKPKVGKRVPKVTVQRRWMVQCKGKEWDLLNKEASTATAKARDDQVRASPPLGSKAGSPNAL